MTPSPIQQTNPKFRTRILTGLVTGMTLGGFLAGALLSGGAQLPEPSFAAPTPPVGSTPTPMAQQPHVQGFAEIVKAVRPAVVNITAMRRLTHNTPSLPFSVPPFGPESGPHEPRGMGTGSGVIVSPDGHIVTNNHVVEGVTRVKVTLPDKREFTGRVIGSDPQSDLAVIKIKASNLPFLPWGDSSSLEVGDYVLAIGNPFGLNSTVTQGIVSAKGRGGMGITRYEDFIQTDAAINPGNSGGALVNMRGELVGINTAILSRTGGYQGIGLAIPTTMSRPIYESLVKTGTVERGYLGVAIQDMTPSLAQSFHVDQTTGALVTNVERHSPADKAGLSRGDTIVEFNGTPVSNPRKLQQLVTRAPIGKTASITVIREGETVHLQATIEKLDEAHVLQG